MEYTTGILTSGIDGDYRSKLRSAKKLAKVEEPDIPIKIEDETTELLPPDSPETPPRRGIEFYFPPSPFGRQRHTSYGDRLITTRDPKYQIEDTPSSSRKTEESRRNTTLPVVKKITEYFVAEVLPSADDTSRRIHRVRSNATVNSQSSTSSLQPANTPHRRSSFSDVVTSNPRRLSSDLRHLPSRLSSITTSSGYSPNVPRFQTLPITEAGRRILTLPTTQLHSISTKPLKILDAGGLAWDFFYHLVDWGPNDIVAVGLDTVVYLFNTNTSEVTKLYDAVPQKIILVKWSQVGSLLIVGVNSGKMHLYDTSTLQRLRTWFTHVKPKKFLYMIATWKANIITSASEKTIYHHDVRSPQESFKQLSGHTQSVHGLRWNPEETMLASSSSDNRVITWNSHENGILHDFKGHRGSVKALAWSPHKRGLLASGGGLGDGTIKLWDTRNSRLLNSVDTGSQVCNLEWSKRANRIVSSHGYRTSADSLSNQIAVWKADTMENIALLDGHDSRVVQLTMSTDGTTIISAAHDQVLLFWDLFTNLPSSKPQSSSLLR